MNDHAELKYRNVALLPNNLRQMQGQSFLLKYSLGLHPLMDYKARTFWPTKEVICLRLQSANHMFEL